MVLADLPGLDVAAGVVATREPPACEPVPWREIVRLIAAAGLGAGEVAACFPAVLR